MSVERTLEFDDWIHDNVESVRQSFDGTEFGVLDYDTAVNMLVLDGLVFPPDDPDDPRWEEVYTSLSATPDARYARCMPVSYPQMLLPTLTD